MQDALVQPLLIMLDCANDLLMNSVLDQASLRIINTILHEATALRDLVISLSEITLKRVREVFDFEARQSLASIIGYTEMLLEDDYGLDEAQRGALEEIGRAGRGLLHAIVS